MTIHHFNADQLCRAGKTHLQNQEPSQALAFFDKALEITPDHRQALLLRAKARLECFATEQGLHDLDHLLNLAPDHLEALLTRGQANFGIGRRQQALDDFNRALALAPDRTDLLPLRGRAHAACGHYQAASSDLTQALAAGLEDEQGLHELLGCCLLSLGDYDAGQAHLCRAYDLQRASRTASVLAGPAAVVQSRLPQLQILLAGTDPATNHQLAMLIRHTLQDEAKCRFDSGLGPGEIVGRLCRSRYELVFCSLECLALGCSTDPDAPLALLSYIKERHNPFLICLAPPMHGEASLKTLRAAGADHAFSRAAPELEQKLPAAVKGWFKEKFAPVGEPDAVE